jgi:hypothetical protein
MPESRDNFGACPQTRWSLIGRAGDATGVQQREALAQLLQLYLPAMRAHLQLRRRLAADRVEDLLQGFLLNRVLEHDLIGSADASRGRFRNLLLTALDRYVFNELRAERAQKRAPKNLAAIEQAADVADDAQPVDHSFDLAWARLVLDQVIERMYQDCQASGRAAVWAVFEGRVIKPTLENQPPITYDQLVATWGFESPSQASNALVTANRMFARTLRSVIAAYEQSADVDEEIADLRRILAGGGDDARRRP